MEKFIYNQLVSQVQVDNMYMYNNTTNISSHQISQFPSM